jgi:hypothetical protein
MVNFTCLLINHDCMRVCRLCDRIVIQGDQKVSVHLMITVQETLKKFLNSFNHLPMITQLQLGITDGVSMSLVPINVWRLAGETMNFTCNFLCCNHQVRGDFLITLQLAC